MSESFTIVVAMDEERGIGVRGALPWRLPGDMAYFKRVTSEAPEGKANAVIMGRKTFESIPPKFRPLAGRLNVVITRNDALTLPDGVLRARSLDEACELLRARPEVGDWFVIGGGEIYGLTLAHPACRRVLLTRVHGRFACDTHLAPFEEHFRLVTQDGPHHDNAVSYTFEVYEK